MTKLRALIIAACLMLIGNAASAIPLGVNILGGAGSWSLSGPTNESADWLLFYSQDFDITPGDYEWSIEGLGVGVALWSLSLDGQTVYTSGDTGFVFKIDDQHNFTATSVPEPGTLSLLGAGLVLIGFSARRRSKRV